MSGALHSHDSVCHYSPAPLVEDFRYILGGRIRLDPASNAFANKVVQAETYWGSGSLDATWHGPLLLNPPGKSKDNPKGAAAWWAKLADEWNKARDWSAIYVGFSLEILQTAQSYNVLQPGDFPHCVPAKRIQFDVERDGERVRGTSPTHGNVIACLAHDVETATRFYERMEKHGWTDRKVRGM